MEERVKVGKWIVFSCGLGDTVFICYVVWPGTLTRLHYKFTGLSCKVQHIFICQESDMFWVGG